jgi:hypothetical protein
LLELVDLVLEPVDLVALSAGRDLAAQESIHRRADRSLPLRGPVQSAAPRSAPSLLDVLGVLAAEHDPRVGGELQRSHPVLPRTGDRHDELGIVDKTAATAVLEAAVVLAVVGRIDAVHHPVAADEVEPVAVDGVVGCPRLQRAIVLGAGIDPPAVLLSRSRASAPSASPLRGGAHAGTGLTLLRPAPGPAHPRALRPPAARRRTSAQPVRRGIGCATGASRCLGGAVAVAHGGHHCNGVRHVPLVMSVAGCDGAAEVGAGGRSAGVARARLRTSGPCRPRGDRYRPGWPGWHLRQPARSRSSTRSRCWRASR